MQGSPVLYCHCAYARVVSAQVKEQVLLQLSESDQGFDSVADLCEMAAKRDPALQRLAQQPGLTIVACYPRAVKWLFSAADAPLAADARILNMRTQTAEEIAAELNGTAVPGETV